jgi:hypothetical protein
MPTPSSVTGERFGVVATSRVPIEPSRGRLDVDPFVADG